MRVAVVGCGYWGSKHVRVLSAIPEVEQVVVVDPVEERVQNLQRTFPSLTSHRTLESALDHIDAVVVATPPTTHAGLAHIAIDAKKHVLIEKPLATTSDDALGLVEAAEDAYVTLMVGHTFEFNAGVWKLRELVDTGELGRIHYLDSARLNLGLYQSDVNVIWDLAPHDVSIFNYVLDSTPVSVQAWGSRHGHRHLEDVAYLRLNYENPDVTANIHVSWLDPCKVRRVTVVGSSKMAVYNDLSTDERIRIFDKGLVTPDGEPHLDQMPMSYRTGDIRSPFVSFEEPLGVQDQEFVRCAMDGRRPRTDGLNGLAVVQVLECANISMREERPVYLDEVGTFAPRLVETQTQLVRVS
jgi:predicted dehydrogenase